MKGTFETYESKINWSGNELEMKLEYKGMKATGKVHSRYGVWEEL